MSGPQVILVRHAHAEWPTYIGRDFDRPLTPRGEEDAARTARALHQAGHRPAMLLVSPARRTSQTAQIIAAALDLPDRALRFETGLYNATPVMLEAELRKVAARCTGMVMLIAHNPGISELGRRLAGDADAPAFATAEWRVMTLPAARA